MERRTYCSSCNNQAECNQCDGAKGGLVWNGNLVPPLRYMGPGQPSSPPSPKEGGPSPAELVDIMRGKPVDVVNHPAHYTQGRIECIDAMEAALTPEEFRGYLKGSIFKYNWRLGHKDAVVQEAGKLQWYANKLCEFLKK